METKISAAIKAYMEGTGFLQREVAESLGVSTSYLNDVIKGKRRLSDDWIRAISDPTIKRILIKARRSEYLAKAEEFRA